MSSSAIVRWNLAFIVAAGSYGFLTDEPYWRETGHGPWLYDYLFWALLALNGPSGFAADFLSSFISSEAEIRFCAQYALWCVLLRPQWKLYHRLALWCRESPPRRLAIATAALLVALIGSAAAYEAWLFGHRPSDGVFIDRYFWFVRVAGIAFSGVVLLACIHLARRGPSTGDLM